MKHFLLFMAAVVFSLTGFSQYCTTSIGDPNNFYGCQYEHISNVTFESINNSTGCSGGTTSYNDYTTQVASVNIGLSYNLSVTLSPDFSDYLTAWIDWNGDDDFNDPGETFVLATSVSLPGPYTSNIVVPNNAVPGNVRMRVMLRWNSAPTACLNSTTEYGEVEDYTVTILPPALTAAFSNDTIEVACHGDTTANLVPNYVGGQTPFTYLWSTGSTDSALYNMGAGSYSVIVTDDNGDMDTAFVEVTQPDSISIAANLTVPLICDYDVSEVEAVGSGGTAITGYLMDTSSANFNPDSSQIGTLVNLADDAVSGALDIGFDFEFYGNTFSQFYIGSNGYISFDPGSSSYEQTLPNGNAPNNVIATVWEDLDPNNGLDGTVSYYVTGSAPFRVLHVNFIDVPYWLGAIGDVTFQLKLFETTNCIEIHTAYAGFSGSATQQTQGIENGDGTEAIWYPGRNGEIWSAENSFVSFCPVDASGLLYTWSTGHLGANITGLTAGTYTVTASDANGCMNDAEVTVSAPLSSFTSALSKEDISCYSFDDGSIDPGITGGSGTSTTWTFDWSNNETSETIDDLAPGTYAVSVQDAVGCTIEVNDITIHEPAILLGSVFNVQGVLCNGDTNGAASIAVSGGVMPYTPVWTNGSIGMSATGLKSGQHNVEVTDSNGCLLYVPVNIPYQYENPSPDLGGNIQSINGVAATLSTVPQSFAAYEWSTGALTPTIDVTATGVYWVEVTSGAGCMGSDTIYVEIWPSGVNDLGANSMIKLFPNPATTSVNLDVPADLTDFTVTISDLKGATVYSKAHTEGGLSQIDISNFASGTYSVSIFTGERSIMNTKLQVIK